jgi:hypothetical protein
MVDSENVRGRLAVEAPSVPFKGCADEDVPFDVDVLLLLLVELIAYGKIL